MKLINLFILVALLAPFLLVIGTAVSSAHILSPLLLEAQNARLEKIVEAGDFIRDVTEGMINREIGLAVKQAGTIKDSSYIQSCEALQRIRMLTAKSV